MIFFCVVILFLPSRGMINISDTIKEGMPFYYMKHFEFPAMLATIEYSIIYRANSKLKMDIYTNENDTSIQKQCSTISYGQLRNENLHKPIRPGEYRFTRCDKYENGSKINCRGKTPMQDYIPRHYGVSFGFIWGIDQRTESLMGLSFNISIYEETNKTSCFTIQMVDHGTVKCSKYYSHTSLPNLVGDPNNTKVITNITINTYEVLSHVEYSCDDEYFTMHGNNTITCLYSREWSQGPKCVNQSTKHLNDYGTSPLFVVMPLLVFASLLYITILVKCRKTFTNPSYVRQRKFDAFVCYCYEENDRQFSEDTIRIELEEKRDPSFKLCIHRRDFRAAWDIKWNIMNAIRNSNSAIIVMSQDYVNSLWCKEEFEDCYMENMKDPAFKMFVIKMQPMETLEIKNEYIKCFLSRKTYLERDDPKLFKKIAEYLTWVKEPKKFAEVQEGQYNPPHSK